MKILEHALLQISRKVRGNLRHCVLAFIDIVCFAAADAFYYISSKHFHFSTLFTSIKYFLISSALLLAVTLTVRVLFGIYRNVWRYTNTAAYTKLIVSDAISCVAVILIERFIPQIYFGVWHIMTVTAFALLAILVSRFSYRMLYKKMNNADKRSSVDRSYINVAIVGAGQVGANLANELKDNFSLGYMPRCFLDVDQSKCGSYVSGLKVENQADALQVIERYGISEFIIALPKIESAELERLYNYYRSFKCGVKIYDAPFRTGEEDASEIKRIVRDFNIEDLLFRGQLNIVDSATSAYYKDKTVLITGGGGSIGSEICRQIAKCAPKCLVIFDIYENNAYEIQQELSRKYGEKLNLCVEIGSVRDAERLRDIFEYYRPQVVFHAAAHKHVPLMEHSACEAIKNNVFGTYNAINLSEEYGAEKFILISTDKAVNPTNIMGASKRICEMLIRSRFDSKTCFAAVRFGNVLGSNGSVIPLFRKQIENGGPVTITDKRIVRYFMTIPEASQLVIQAGAMAKKNELFVLDMGKPIKIYDLALNMISLMGYKPGKDIEIKEIGLRPGEKLYEELLIRTEELDKTSNELIFIERDAPMAREVAAQKLELLSKALEDTHDTLDMTAIKAAIKATVPTFADPEVLNEKATEAKEMKMAAGKI